MKPIAHCKVNVGDSVDHTVKVMLRGNSLPDNTEFLVLISKQPAFNPNEQSIGLAVATEGVVHLTKEVADGVLARIHYRILFEQYAQTIANVKRVSHALHATRDVLKGVLGAISVHYELAFLCACSIYADGYIEI